MKHLVGFRLIKLHNLLVNEIVHLPERHIHCNLYLLANIYIHTHYKIVSIYYLHDQIRDLDERLLFIMLTTSKIEKSY